MTRVSSARIRTLLDAAHNGSSTTAQGRALENLICYLFGRVPGITVTSRDTLNAFESEELDIAFWNERNLRGFYFLPYIILCESKDWSGPVGSSQIAWFDTKLRNRGLSMGVLVAMNGITGEASEITAGHNVVAGALREGRQIVVITRRDIEAIGDTVELVQLVKKKLCDLAVAGTALV